MPEIFNQCVDRTSELHPDWEINFYNEDDALQIVKHHFPELEDLYQSYPLNVQRADIFRILLMYLYGGFYLDLDMHCLKSLDPLLKFNIVLGEEKHLKREVCDVLGLKNPKRIANYMFGSRPGHVFWLDFLNELMEKSSMEIKDENDVLESTGPGLLTDFYHSKVNYYKDVVLLLNKDRSCLKEFHREISCHFGNYAAHLHTGTWRWQNGRTPKFDDESARQDSLNVLKSSFRYKIENNDHDHFYFNDEISGTETHYSKILIDVLKGLGTAVKELTDLNNKKVILFGPINRWMNSVLPVNKYVYCDNLFTMGFTNAEVYFINKNISCCIVPTQEIKKQYELNGIKTPVKIIEAGFQRYKRELENERDIQEFKLGCLACSFDAVLLEKLMESCISLQKNAIIPSIKIKLYDPDAKFKHLYATFDISEIIEYTSVIISEDFFSRWFKDLAGAFFGPYAEVCQTKVLEFLYLGIPVIVPNNHNYKEILEKTTTNPGVVFPAAYNDLPDGNFTTASIENAILNLYENYDSYSTDAVLASEELEDLYTKEEIQQNILNLLSEL